MTIFSNNRTVIFSTFLSINIILINNAFAEVANNIDSLPNIAKPNWWQKSKQKTSSPHKMTASQVTSVKQEPLSNFLVLPEKIEWEPLIGPTGIASKRLAPKENGKGVELAIIRMNNTVPMDAIIGIWKQKAGVTSGAQLERKEIVNKHKQSFQLLIFKGEKQQLAVAYHKQNKYTFFRLSSANGLSEGLLIKFENLLKSAIIVK